MRSIFTWCLSPALPGAQDCIASGPWQWQRQRQRVECGAVVVVGIVCQHAAQERFAPIPIRNGPEREYPGHHFKEYPQLGSNMVCNEY